MIMTGEGSKGGRVIGHTKSGKAIYANCKGQHESYSHWSAQDHMDAHDFHMRQTKKKDTYSNTGFGHATLHANLAMSHLDAAHKKKGRSLKKAMEAGTTTGTETHDQSMTQAPLKKESIDGATAKSKKKKKEAKEVAHLDPQKISKGKILSEIFSIFGFTDMQQANAVYQEAEKIQKSLTPNMENGAQKVTKESLQKAMEILDLVEKAEQGNEEVTAEGATETGAAAATTTTTVELTELQKAEKAVADAQAALERVKNEAATATSTPAVGADMLQKAEQLEKKIGAMATLIQSKDEAIDDLKKGLEQVIAFNTELGKKIGMIERQPLDRKSITTETGAVVERFNKGGEDNGVRTLSITDRKDRAEIADVLFKAATKEEGKIDAELSKAVSYVELGQVPAPLIKRLRSEFNINVVR